MNTLDCTRAYGHIKWSLALVVEHTGICACTGKSISLPQYKVSGLCTCFVVEKDSHKFQVFPLTNQMQGSIAFFIFIVDSTYVRNRVSDLVATCTHFCIFYACVRYNNVTLTTAGGDMGRSGYIAH